MFLLGDKKGKAALMCICSSYTCLEQSRAQGLSWQQVRGHLARHVGDTVPGLGVAPSGGCPQQFVTWEW